MDTPSSRPRSRMAVKALRRAWVPGYGIVAGRQALKHMRWTGEEGRDIAVRAIRINAAVTAALAAGLLWVSFLDSGGSPTTTVGQLDTAECFKVPTAMRDSLSATQVPEVVNVVDCAREHDGEVLGRWDSDVWRYYPDHEEMVERAAIECDKQLAAYAADTWLLPAEVSVAFAYPGEKSWNSGDHRVVCYMSGEGDRPMVTSLRQDATARTPHQSAYLAASNAHDMAANREPDLDSAVKDLSAWKQYAADMAAAASEERRALLAHHWPAAAAGYIAALESADERAAADWRKAAAATDPVEVDALANRAVSHHDYEVTVAARRALGLATSPNRRQSV